jgi:hypothetical protein
MNGPPDLCGCWEDDSKSKYRSRSLRDDKQNGNDKNNGNDNDNDKSGERFTFPLIAMRPR